MGRYDYPRGTRPIYWAVQFDDLTGCVEDAEFIDAPWQMDSPDVMRPQAGYTWMHGSQEMEPTKAGRVYAAIVIPDDGDATVLLAARQPRVVWHGTDQHVRYIPVAGQPVVEYVAHGTARVEVWDGYVNGGDSLPTGNVG